MYIQFVKPFFDYLFSFLGLIIVCPIFLVLTIIGGVVFKSNPFFVQQRPGKNEVSFKLIKFKSMVDVDLMEISTRDDAQRLNAYGKFLRKTSLDELPQLINILKGEMSFIGPRPLLMEYLPKYNLDQRKRHWVLPGISGLAQVNGRTKLTWEQQFELDVEYVKSISFRRDFFILMKSIFNVVVNKDLGRENQFIRKPFQGNE